MLFAAKTGSLSNNRTKTPQKAPSIFNSNGKQSKKQGTGQKQKTSGKQNPTSKYKVKDAFTILQALEQIYNELDFNQYDIFPLQNIQKAKRNIQNLLGFLGERPTCRYHKDLINLYCENDKSVVCVSCVYKTAEHKSHKVKSLQSVEKILDFQTIRCEQKTKGLVDQLSELKDEIDYMTKRIGENYMMISKYTISIIDQSIKQLNVMKVDMEKKLSLAYRRTNTVINRYNQALQSISNHLEGSLQKTVIMNSLSKHMLLRELTLENELIQALVNKFNDNRILMEQWNKSNQDFQKLVLKKSNSINSRIDAFIVTQF